MSIGLLFVPLIYLPGGKVCTVIKSVGSKLFQLERNTNYILKATMHYAPISAFSNCLNQDGARNIAHLQLHTTNNSLCSHHLNLGLVRTPCPSMICFLKGTTPDAPHPTGNLSFTPPLTIHPYRTLEDGVIQLTTPSRSHGSFEKRRSKYKDLSMRHIMGNVYTVDPVDRRIVSILAVKWFRTKGFTWRINPACDQSEGRARLLFSNT